MVGIIDIVDRAIQRFHIGRVEDMVDAKPETILIIGNTHAAPRLGKGIDQPLLKRMVRV